MSSKKSVKKVSPKSGKITRKEFVKEWVKDLRSGKYSQVCDVLKGKTKGGRTGYCCLGVSFRTAQRLGLDPKGELEAELVDIDKSIRGGLEIPGEWLEKIMGSNNPSIEISNKGDTFPVDCSEANDEYKCSFKTIADALETKYVKGK